MMCRTSQKIAAHDLYFNFNLIFSNIFKTKHESELWKAGLPGLHKKKPNW